MNTSPAAPSRAISVLIVDDDRDGAQLLRELLELEGFVAAVAFDGESALQLCATRTWDVLLIDFQMPDMSGTQLARRIRLELQPAPLLVALSGYAAHDLQPADGHDPVFDHLLRKPVELEKLCSVLNAVRD